jgi:hypothetical protein
VAAAAVAAAVAAAGYDVAHSSSQYMPQAAWGCSAMLVCCACSSGMIASVVAYDVTLTVSPSLMSNARVCAAACACRC